MDTQEEALTRTAYHEAGHIVIGHILGLEHSHVSIVPNGNVLGEARLARPLAWPRGARARQTFADNHATMLLRRCGGGTPSIWFDHRKRRGRSRARRGPDPHAVTPPPVSLCTRPPGHESRQETGSPRHPSRSAALGRHRPRRQGAHRESGADNRRPPPLAERHGGAFGLGHHELRRGGILGHRVADPASNSDLLS